MFKRITEVGKRVLVSLTAIGLIAISTVGLPAQASAQSSSCTYIPYKDDLVPLVSLWSQDRLDNLTAATLESKQGGWDAGYEGIRYEGWIYANPHPGTIPLFSFWSQGNLDNLTVATPESQKSALDAGYTMTRLEGWVLAKPSEGTTALLSYWSEDRTDQYLVGTGTGQKGAIDAGYVEYNLEGYAYMDSTAECGSVRID